MATIDKAFDDLVVYSSASISEALIRICENHSRMVILINENGVVEGVATDGDFRRWVVEQSKVDLDQSVKQIMNRSFVSARHDLFKGHAEDLFRVRDGIEIIPLLDHRGRLVSVVRRSNPGLSIGYTKIGGGHPTYLIAEIGNNHNGSVERAKELVDASADAGANCAKFQLRDMATLYASPSGQQGRGGSSDLGTEYTLDLLSKYQLPLEQLFEVFDHCRKLGIEPLCTPWDYQSLVRLEEYGLCAYKIASADFTNHALLKAAADTGKPLIVSTGMASESEIRDGITFLNSLACQYVLLHCNSTYPAPYKDVHLQYLRHLRDLGAEYVGYSGHERGVEVPIAAVAMGAQVIEKHFTVDRTLEGNDHKVSLLPFEYAAMVSQIRNVEQALGFSGERTLSQGELMNREVLGKSVVANTDISAGTRIEFTMLDIKSPGQGLAPYRLEELVGQTIRRDVRSGECFFPSDLAGADVSARSYDFDRNFGIPVRYHDAADLLPLSNFSLVEFHLSYRDLELNPDDFFSDQSNLNLVVHCPELFENDHLLDLCSLDQAYRQCSIDHLKRVVDSTHAIQQYFPNSDRALIIVNVGGHTQDKPIPKSDLPDMYELVADGLAQAADTGVEFIPQTMPPFPWHFGGQRLHNLFVSQEEIIRFCDTYRTRVCLDVSHSKLACNHYHWSFTRFLAAVLPHTAHLHIADSAGVDGEGLQIGEGDIDFAALGQALKSCDASVGFIPEIWQGHKNRGEGFWSAFELLEDYLS